MNDTFVSPSQPSGKTPDYFNPHNIPTDPSGVSSLLSHEPPEANPIEELKKKYPIKTIVGAVVVLVMVLAIPVGVYLNQRPTRVFIEATATPSPTPTPTPTPTESPVPDL